LRELQDTITGKVIWPRFEAKFGSKEAVIAKFDQLAELRNGIRHSRAVGMSSVKKVKRQCLSYPAWKAAAVKALQKLHERAARVTRDGFWTRCYVRNLSPEKAVELAAREYDATHAPDWLKRRR
jgi:hypothetical protein